MYQRIMEILVLLMDEFDSDSWNPDEMDQVSEDLIERGYTEQEINTAFYWLYNRFHPDSEAPSRKTAVHQPAEQSHRILHAFERRYVTPEAFGYLIQLKHLGLIGWEETEEVIERLLVLGIQSASVDDVNTIVQSILFEEGRFQGSSLRNIASSRKGETCH